MQVIQKWSLTSEDFRYDEFMEDRELIYIEKNKGAIFNLPLDNTTDLVAYYMASGPEMVSFYLKPKENKANGTERVYLYARSNEARTESVVYALAGTRSITVDLSEIENSTKRFDSLLNNPIQEKYLISENTDTEKSIIDASWLYDFKKEAFGESRPVILQEELVTDENFDKWMEETFAAYELLVNKNDVEVYLIGTKNFESYYLAVQHHTDYVEQEGFEYRLFNKDEKPTKIAFLGFED